MLIPINFLFLSFAAESSASSLLSSSRSRVWELLSPRPFSAPPLKEVDSMSDECRFTSFPAKLSPAGDTKTVWQISQIRIKHLVARHNDEQPSSTKRGIVSGRVCAHVSSPAFLKQQSFHAMRIWQVVIRRQSNNAPAPTPAPM